MSRMSEQRSPEKVTCSLCGKGIVSGNRRDPNNGRTYLEHHQEALNCKMRVWGDALRARGWSHFKFSFHDALKQIGVPFEVSPNEPKQGQFIMVPSWVCRAIPSPRIMTLAGWVNLKRPPSVIISMIKEAHERNHSAAT